MKIAVIDHVGNHGGGSRVVRMLLPALKRLDPTVELTYFGNPASIRREELRADFRAQGIRVVDLASLSIAHRIALRSEYAGKILRLAQARWLESRPWLPLGISGDVALEISRRVRGFDVAFFPWPFMLRCPRLDCPVVGLFHDFNFKYYFGGSFVFSPAQRVQLEHDMPKWLESATPVVSTHFMASELATFYPAATHKAEVVHLPPLGGTESIESSLAHEVVRQLGVTLPYLLYPTHMCTHKNAGPLIAALALLRSQGRALSLVLTGAGTEAVRGHAHSIGVRLDAHGGDVVGLGYVSNLQVDSLIQCASVVVNPSLYEAGNGPGLDAWGRGTPVAMSNIPAFLEHIEVSDVRAEVFDPRNPQDIADKISAILDNSGSASADAEHSRRALERVSWDRTASAYLRIFRRVAQVSSSPRFDVSN